MNYFSAWLFVTPTSVTISYTSTTLFITSSPNLVDGLYHLYHCLRVKLL